jgi:hypothetical protein
MRNGVQIAVDTVDAQGNFELLIPKEPVPDERLVVLALTTLVGGESTLVGVIDPDLPPAMYRTGATGSQPAWWAWTFIDARAEEIVIRESAGSGAVQVFRNLLLAAGKNAAHGGLLLPSIMSVFAPGVDFDCGACFGSDDGQGWVFVSGGDFPADKSDAVLLHESGHYAFFGLGPSSGEAGGHCLGVPAPPGQALSEGHASWYSADLRKDPKLYSEQMGTFFYWDIGKRSPPPLFEPPDLAAGLDQNMNEAWVSAVLWDLAILAGTGAPIHRGLMAQELRSPLASGYEGKYWWAVDHLCRPVDPVPSGSEAAILSDLLDAMVCGGFPADSVSSVFSDSYPYDPQEPSCK